MAASPYFHKTPSLDFWIEWAKKRRSVRIRQQLNDALAAAHAAEPNLIESIVEDIVRIETESTDPCIFEGCSRRALTGRRICARHTLSDNDLMWRKAHLYQLPRQYGG
jgi:hypothetical protein